MRIYLKFDVALAHTVNVIVYSVFENVIKIDSTRNVLLIIQTRNEHYQIDELCRSDQVLSPKFGGVFTRLG